VGATAAYALVLRGIGREVVGRHKGGAEFPIDIAVTNQWGARILHGQVVNLMDLSGLPS